MSRVLLRLLGLFLLGVGVGLLLPGVGPRLLRLVLLLLLSTP